jgi:hypothetical protein
LIIKGSLNVSQYHASVLRKAVGMYFAGKSTCESISAVAGLKAGTGRLLLPRAAVPIRTCINTAFTIRQLTHMWLRKYPVNTAFAIADIAIPLRLRARPPTSSPAVWWGDQFGCPDDTTRNKASETRRRAKLRCFSPCRFQAAHYSRASLTAGHNYDVVNSRLCKV